MLGLGLGLKFGGGGVFTPSSLSPSLWLDSSDLSSIVSSAGAVSQWTDKSGNGFNATQGTALNKPVTGTRTINGLNAIDFDGTNSYFLCAAMIGLLQNAQNTVFVVAGTDDITVSTQELIGCGNTGGRRWGLSLEPASGRYRAKSEYTDSNMPTTLTTGARILSYTTSPTILQGYVDGAAAADTGVPSTYTGAFNGYVGESGTGTRWNGTIAEIIILPYVATSGQLAQLNLYLKQKWATP